MKYWNLKQNWYDNHISFHKSSQARSSSALSQSLASTDSLNIAVSDLSFKALALKK
jgi:hypothetical protein